MTEKEKMLSGALYNAGDPELVWERNRAKALCEKLNVCPAGTVRPESGYFPNSLDTPEEILW